MKKGFSLVLFVIIFGIIFYLFFGLRKINEETIYVGPLEKIKIATYRGERSSLIYVADEKGFFQKNGLELEILENDSGVKSIESIKNNEVDIGTAAEYPFVNNILDNDNDLKIFAVIDFVKAYEIIANKESGINSVGDLKGKRIGLKKKSQAEFLFGVFLTTNNIEDNEVKIVDLDPSEMKGKLLNNEIDVSVVCDPFTDELKNALNNDFLLWNAQPNRRFYFLALAREEYINNNSELIDKFLKSLIQAEVFIENNKTEAQIIVQDRIKVDLNYLQSVWDKNNFNVTLEQSLILTMEDELRWKNSKEKVSRIEPNFLDYIYLKSLDSLDSDRVTIIR